MTPLLQKQFLFAQLLAELIRWIPIEGQRRNQDWRVKMGEGLVALTDAADKDYDGPHMEHGNHYNSLANDLILFVNGVLVEDSDHPAYQVIGGRWKQMNHLCRWGGDFVRKDANHFSLIHEGKA